MLFEEGRVNMCQEYDKKMFFVSVFYLYNMLLDEKNQQILQGLLPEKFLQSLCIETESLLNS